METVETERAAGSTTTTTRKKKKNSNKTTKPAVENMETVETERAAGSTTTTTAPKKKKNSNKTTKPTVESMETVETEREAGSTTITTTMKKKNNNNDSKTTKLTVENYLDYFHNRSLDLNAGHLRQIIRMQGYGNMYKFRKSVLVDVITTMELMDLRRSTLLDSNISGDDARLTLEEVVKDLKDLEWHECHVTSLHTQGGSPISSYSSTTTTSDQTLPKRLKTQQERTNKVDVEGGLIDDPSDSTTVAAEGWGQRGMHSRWWTAPLMIIRPEDAGSLTNEQVNVVEQNIGKRS